MDAFMMGGGEGKETKKYESMDAIAIAMNASKRIAKAQKKKN